MDVFQIPERSEIVLVAPKGRLIRVVRGKRGKQWIEQSRNGKIWNKDFSDWIQESFKHTGGELTISAGK